MFLWFGSYETNIFQPMVLTDENEITHASEELFIWR
jgi:hypothetical protein